VRILNVNAYFDLEVGGGTAERVFQTSRALVALGVECAVLATDAGLQDAPARNDLEFAVHILPCASKRYLLPLFQYRRVVDLVRKFDIVHLMNHWTVLNLLVAKAARSCSKPYVVCPAGALPIYGRSKTLKQLYNWGGGQQLVAGAAGHIAISTNEIVQFGDYGVPSERITLIPNGINPADFEDADDQGFRERFGLPSGPLILFVGRLNHIKGPDLLLEAFAKLARRYPDHHLVFIGPDNGMQAVLKSMVRQEGLENRVHFLGYLGGRDKSQAYHAADFLAIPSRQEAMSIVALEAGACGTPVLLTDQCGFDVIERVGGGKVVPATVEGLGAGLETMCGARALLQEMGSVFYEFVLANYTWEITAQKYIDLSRRIIGR